MTPEKALMLLELTAPPREDGSELTEGEMDERAREILERQDVEDEWYEATEGTYQGPRAVQATVRTTPRPTLRTSKPRIRL